MENSGRGPPDILISADPRRSLGSEKHPTSRLKSNEKKGGPGSPSLQAHLGLSYLSTDAHNPPQPHKPSSPENKSGSPALGPRPKPHELSYPISWQTPLAPFVCHKAESWIWSLSLARSVQLHDVHRDHLLHVELLRRLVWNDPPSLVQEAQLAQVELLPLAVRVLQETQGQPPLHLEVHVRTGLVPDSKLQAWPMKERKKETQSGRMFWRRAQRIVAVVVSWRVRFSVQRRDCLPVRHPAIVEDDDLGPVCGKTPKGGLGRGGRT